MKKTTGELIKAARKKAGLTQAELGAKLGISSAAISQFEKPSSNPTSETLEKIATVLGCSPAYLMGWTDTLTGKDTYNLYVDIPATDTNEAIYIAMKELLTINGYHKKADTLTQDEAVKLYQTLSFDSPQKINKLDANHFNETETRHISTKRYSDSLLHENSYSYANSEEEYEEHLNQHQNQGEQILLFDYRKLNDTGQSEARKRVNELTEIPRYTKPDDSPED